MQSTEHLLNQRRVALLVTLVVCLASVYMLTYSGRIESGDSLTYFDATGSLVKQGDTLLDVSLWASPPDPTHLESPFPLKELPVESRYPPMQPFLAASLYWLADKLPGFGLVHAVWLFNLIVCALTGGVVFLYSVALGYEEKIGILAALVFGLGTIAWPYSKTFFRDPLAMLLVVLAGLLLERLRVARWRSPFLILAITLVGLAGLHTKSSVLFSVPALTVLVSPSFRLFQWPRVQKALGVLLLLLLVAVGFLVYSPILDAQPSYTSIISLDLRSSIPSWRQINFGFSPYYTRVALHSYLFSVGGSFWGTSPVVLLALPGLWILYRQRRQRYIWVITLMVLVYAFGHAIGAKQHWFGGLSWPPRFMLPVTPFIILGTLPTLNRLLHPQVLRWLTLAALVLLAYSLWVQFSGVSLNWNVYNATLPPEANGLTEWSPGLNQVQYLRWVVMPRFWSNNPIDFAWVRTGFVFWALGFVLLVVFSATLLWRILTEQRTKSVRLRVVGILPLSLVLLTGFGLRGIYVDDLYQGANPALHSMLSIIDQVTERGDVLLLSNPRYERFFLNYAKLINTRVITLSAQPGERPSEEQLPEVVSDNPDVLLTPETIPTLYMLAQQHERLWLLVDSGPFLTWSTRPVERFMSSHFYPVREIQTNPPDPTLRLIEYSTIFAPDSFAFRSAENSSDLRYGDSIRLLGYDLPRGTTFAPGDVMPISLYWQTDIPITQDYTVAWKLLDIAGTVVAAGIDSKPGGGFALTNIWQPSVPIWDNRAMSIPNALPSGDYRVGVILYDVDTNGALRNLPVFGSQVVADGQIGLLNTPIHVE